MFANMFGKIRGGGGGGRREYGENAGGDASHGLLAAESHGQDFPDNGNLSDDNDQSPDGQDEKVPWGECVCARALTSSVVAPAIYRRHPNESDHLRGTPFGRGRFYLPIQTLFQTQFSSPAGLPRATDGRCNARGVCRPLPSSSSVSGVLVVFRAGPRPAQTSARASRPRC